MSFSIWKYVISLDDEVDLEMPKGAKLLHVAEQRGDVCLWAMVDTSAPNVTRCISVRGTGHPCDESILRAPHIGTVSLHVGGLIFHLFDRGEL